MNIERILFFTDPHYSSITPASRIDDFAQTMLDKTRQVIKVAKEQKVDLVLIGGDIIHIKNIALAYLNQLIRVYRDFPCPVYSCIGNHDEYYGRADSIDRTPLGNLFESGAIKHLRELEYDNCFIVGCDSGNPLPEPMSGKFSILVAHGFLDKTYDEEPLSEEALKKFNLVLLGHDHNVFETTVLGNTVVVRPGALSRATQHKANLVRGVYVTLVDMVGRKITPIPLDVLPFDKVFLQQSIDKKEVYKDVKEFVGSLETVYLNRGMSVETLLNSICVDQVVRNRVKFFLQKFAIL